MLVEFYQCGKNRNLPHQKAIVLIKATQKSKSVWLCYLKDFIIQDPGAKHGYAFSVDDSLVTSGERPGHLLLTIHYDGDALLLHAESYTMPSVRQEGRSGLKCSQGLQVCQVSLVMLSNGYLATCAK